MASKCATFKEVLVGHKLKYECLLCSRQLSSKQNIIQHLHNIHSLSPVKRQKKLYIDNEELEIPQRTAFRWKRKEIQRATQRYEQNQHLHNNNFASHGNESLECAVDTTSQETSDRNSFRDTDCDSVVDLPSDPRYGCPSEPSDIGPSNTEYMSDISHTEEEFTEARSASDTSSDTDSTSD